MPEEKNKEILTEKLENFLKSIDDLRPNVCGFHFGAVITGFNILCQGMFGESTLTNEQVKIINRWCDRQMAGQKDYEKQLMENPNLNKNPDDIERKNIAQFFDDEYGAFDL